MSTIKNYVDIKRALYLVSGTNPSSACGGGRAKIEHHDELASLPFASYEVLGGPLSLAWGAGGKELTIWGTPIKNCIMA